MNKKQSLLILIFSFNIFKISNELDNLGDIYFNKINTIEITDNHKDIDKNKIPKVKTKLTNKTKLPDKIKLKNKTSKYKTKNKPSNIQYIIFILIGVLLIVVGSLKYFGFLDNQKKLIKNNKDSGSINTPLILNGAGPNDFYNPSMISTSMVRQANTAFYPPIIPNIVTQPLSSENNQNLNLSFKANSDDEKNDSKLRKFTRAHNYGQGMPIDGQYNTNLIVLSENKNNNQNLNLSFKANSDDEKNDSKPRKIFKQNNNDQFIPIDGQYNTNSIVLSEDNKTNLEYIQNQEINEEIELNKTLTSLIQKRKQVNNELKILKQTLEEHELELKILIQKGEQYQISQTLDSELKILDHELKILDHELKILSTQQNILNNQYEISNIEQNILYNENKLLLSEDKLDAVQKAKTSQNLLNDINQKIEKKYEELDKEYRKNDEEIKKILFLMNDINLQISLKKNFCNIVEIVLEQQEDSIQKISETIPEANNQFNGQHQEQNIQRIINLEDLIQDHVFYLQKPIQSQETDELLQLNESNNESILESGNKYVLKLPIATKQYLETIDANFIKLISLSFEMCYAKRSVEKIIETYMDCVTDEDDEKHFYNINQEQNLRKQYKLKDTGFIDNEENKYFFYLTESTVDTDTIFRSKNIHIEIFNNTNKIIEMIYIEELDEKIINYPINKNIDNNFISFKFDHNNKLMNLNFNDFYINRIIDINNVFFTLYFKTNDYKTQEILMNENDINKIINTTENLFKELLIIPTIEDENIERTNLKKLEIDINIEYFKQIQEKGLERFKQIQEEELERFKQYQTRRLEQIEQHQEEEFKQDQQEKLEQFQQDQQADFTQIQAEELEQFQEDQQKKLKELEQYQEKQLELFNQIINNGKIQFPLITDLNFINQNQKNHKENLKELIQYLSDNFMYVENLNQQIYQLMEHKSQYGIGIYQLKDENGLIIEKFEQFYLKFNKNDYGIEIDILVKEDNDNLKYKKLFNITKHFQNQSIKYSINKNIKIELAYNNQRNYIYVINYFWNDNYVCSLKKEDNTWVLEKNNIYIQNINIIEASINPTETFLKELFNIPTIEDKNIERTNLKELEIDINIEYFKQIQEKELEGFQEDQQEKLEQFQQDQQEDFKQIQEEELERFKQIQAEKLELFNQIIKNGPIQFPLITDLNFYNIQNNELKELIQYLSDNFMYVANLNQQIYQLMEHKSQYGIGIYQLKDEDGSITDRFKQFYLKFNKNDYGIDIDILVKEDNDNLKYKKLFNITKHFQNQSIKYSINKNIKIELAYNNQRNYIYVINYFWNDNYVCYLKKEEDTWVLEKNNIYIQNINIIEASIEPTETFLKELFNIPQ